MGSAIVIVAGSGRQSYVDDGAKKIEPAKSCNDASPTHETVFCQGVSKIIGVVSKSTGISYSLAIFCEVYAA